VTARGRSRANAEGMTPGLAGIQGPLRQAEGIALAKAAGKYRGRARTLTADQLAQARAQIAVGVPKAKIARDLDVDRKGLSAPVRSVIRLAWAMLAPIAVELSHCRSNATSRAATGHGSPVTPGGLTPMPPLRWAALQADLAAAERWVMDGDLGPYDVLAPRIARADTVSPSAGGARAKPWCLAARVAVWVREVRRCQMA
jgi:hypothetical protein